jgi:hypothetical protein
VDGKATNKFVNVVTKINISKLIKSTIDSGMRCFSNGYWGIKKVIKINKVLHKF